MANIWDGIKKRREVHTRRRELTVEELGRVVAAVAALPDVVKPGTGTSTTDTVTPRVKALCAALDALDAQEREMVLRHLQSAGRAVSVAPAPCAPESTPPIVQYPLVPVAAA